jgi:hypothetical protein
VAEARQALFPDLADAADVALRAGSAAAARQRRRRIFIGIALRRSVKPECISALTERAIARATTSCGHRCFSWNCSARYSQMARLSQIVISPATSTGTRPAAENSRCWVAVSGWSSSTRTSWNGMPKAVITTHGPHRPRRIILVADDEGQAGLRLAWSRVCDRVGSSSVVCMWFLFIEVVVSARRGRGSRRSARRRQVVRRHRLQRRRADAQAGRGQRLDGRIDDIIDLHRIEVVAAHDGLARQQFEQGRLQPASPGGNGQHRPLAAAVAACQAHQLGQR